MYVEEPEALCRVVIVADAVSISEESAWINESHAKTLLISFWFLIKFTKKIHIFYAHVVFKLVLLIKSIGSLHH